MTPEFPRAERVDTIGDVPRTVRIEADEAERRRLAGRFGLIAVDALAAEFTLYRDAAGIVAQGRVTATVTQACSITGDPIGAVVHEPVHLRFVEPSEHADEIELDDGAIDLGEAAAETMALALDPYPRSPAAEAALRAAGVKREDEVENAAFGGLAALRDRLRS